MIEGNGQMLPESALDAWTNAEAAAFCALCHATGMEAGARAFLGEVTDFCNAFYFTNDTIQTGGEAFYTVRAATSFVLPYYAVGIFDSRRAAQRWAMAVVCALPLVDAGNAALFRCANDAIGSLSLEELVFRGESSPKPAYTLKLSFDLVVKIFGDPSPAGGGI